VDCAVNEKNAQTASKGRPRCKKRRGVVQSATKKKDEERGQLLLERKRGNKSPTCWGRFSADTVKKRTMGGAEGFGGGGGVGGNDETLKKGGEGNDKGTLLEEEFRGGM